MFRSGRSFRLGPALLGMALALASCAGDAAPRPSEFAFLTYRDGNGEVYLGRVGDSTVTDLTNDPSFDGFPSWSPDGKRLAFDSDRAAKGNRDIYVMDADGRNVRRLTDHPSYDLTPAWSPDGSQIAFMSLRNSEWDAANPEAAPFRADLYVINVDGTGLTQLTSAPEHDQSPAWSADGMALVFSREIDGRGQLFSIAANGANERRLRTSESYDASPAVSPDGSRIAFYGVAQDSAHIFIMNIDGSGVEQVTHTFQENYYPAWAPDGKRICYTALVGGQWDIYVVNLTTGEEAPLVTNPARDEACAWRP